MEVKTHVLFVGDMEFDVTDCFSPQGFSLNQAAEQAILRYSEKNRQLFEPDETM